MDYLNVISHTHFKPRSLRCLKNALQPALSSFALSQIQRISLTVHRHRNQQRHIAHLACLVLPAPHRETTPTKATGTAAERAPQHSRA
jgi:hypothetical protein